MASRFSLRPSKPFQSTTACTATYVPVPPVGLDEDGYLVEDSKGQNTWHFSQTSLWYPQLKHWLPTATVCSNLAMHYREGDRGATLVPDPFVAQTPPRENRQSYKLWEDPLPELVIEMLSEEDSEDDVGPKQFTYEYLGVREYWLFDPEGFELPTPLVGYRLHEGRYRPIETDAAGLRHSDVLGLRPACPRPRTALSRPGDQRRLENVQRGPRRSPGGETAGRRGRTQGGYRRARVDGGKAPCRRRRARVGAPPLAP